MLESAEIRELELKSQSRLCKESGLEFVEFPIRDRGVPESVREVSVLVARLHGYLIAGKGVAIHCRAGIGRTGLVAGCLVHRLGVPLKEIFSLLSRSRGVIVPDTEAQIHWLEKYARVFASGN